MTETKAEYRLTVMPQMSLVEAAARYNGMVEFVRTIMKDGVDFGVVPGTVKPTLLKPGAEKLCTLFRLYPRPELIEKAEDWTGHDHGGEPFFYYLTRVHLTNDFGVVVASADGSCNSWESRYRYRWVPESEIPPGMDKSTLRTQGGTITEYAFAIEKAETSGKYGKPTSYWQTFQDAIANGTARKVSKTSKAGKTSDAWEIDGTMYRIPNPNPADVANTVLKQSAKRGLVAVTLIAANASEFFTQDLEDMAIEGEWKEVIAEPTAKPKPHWIDDPKTRAACFAWLKEQKLNRESALALLGLEHMHDYKGTKDEFKAAVMAAIEAEATEELKNAPVDPNDGAYVVEKR